MNKRPAILLLSSILLSLSSRAQSTLKVTINNIRSGKGVCCVVLFSDPGAFPGEYKRAVKRKIVRAKKGSTDIEFDQIPSGTYAIAVIHDENEDGKLNTNFLGIPKEGYGASNNDLPLTSAPKFSLSAFKVTETGKSLDINLKYF